MNGSVGALTVHDGKLIAGGYFTIAGSELSAYPANWSKHDHCRVDRVGDANGLGGDEPTTGDVARLVDAEFISLTRDGLLACVSEGDMNQSGGTDPTCGDTSILIDYLFITGPSLGLPECM